MPQIDNTSEKVQNMLKANGIVEELQSDVTKLQSDVGDRSGHNLNLTEQVDVIHQRQDGYVSGSVAVPRAKKAEQDGEGNNIVGTYVDNSRFIDLSNDLYQLFDSTTPMGDRRVKAATRDALGNEIHTTYSTKQDLLYAEGIIQEFQIEDEIIQIRDSERIKNIQPGVKYLNQASTGKRGVIVVPAPNDTQFFFDPDGNVYKRIKKEGTWTEWQPIGNGGGTNITVDTEVSTKSNNPVANSAITQYVNNTFLLKEDFKDIKEIYFDNVVYYFQDVSELDDLREGMYRLHGRDSSSENSYHKTGFLFCTSAADPSNDVNQVLIETDGRIWVRNNGMDNSEDGSIIWGKWSWLPNWDQVGSMYATKDELINCTKVWSQGGKYFAGDMVIAQILNEDSDGFFTVVLVCTQGHVASEDWMLPTDDALFSERWYYSPDYALRSKFDDKGNDIAEKYATKEEVTSQIGDIETSLENIINKYGLGGETV